MKEKDTFLHSKLDKNVNLFRYQYTFSTFVTNGSCNAKGRFCIGLPLLLLFLMTCQEKAPFVRGSFFALLSFLLPVVVTITAKYITPAFGMKRDNLYDFLLGFGTYAIAFGIGTGALYGIGKLIMRLIKIPEIVFLGISAAGLAGLGINYILMKHLQKKQMKEAKHE